MDTHRGISYFNGHETTRDTPESGETSTPGGSPFEGGQAVSRRGSNRRCIAEFGRTMAAILPTRGQARTACEAVPRPNTAVEPATERTLGSIAASGSAGGWIYHQPLDPASHRRGYPPAVRCHLHDTERLEADAGHGLELPDTRQTGPGTQRTDYPVLEAPCVASYKKKPQHLEPIWAFLMRAGSCLYRRSPGHGRHEEKRRFYRRQETGRRYRPSRLSPSHPRGDGLDYTVAFTRTRIFALSKSFSSLAIFCVICEAMWCCSGIADSRIDPGLSRASSLSILACMCTRCLRMRLS